MRQNQKRERLRRMTVKRRVQLQNASRQAAENRRAEAGPEWWRPRLEKGWAISHNPALRKPNPPAVYTHEVSIFTTPEQGVQLRETAKRLGMAQSALVRQVLAEVVPALAERAALEEKRRIVSRAHVEAIVNAIIGDARG